jgi:Cu(I)/Ag(I) efflux system periplasmic protein CusF
MRFTRLLLVAIAVAVSAPLAAAAAVELAQAAAAQPVEGEVTRINKDTNKISIRHGPLPQFDMPAMNMVYAVKEPAFLDKVKVGSKVVFTADKIDGTFTVLSIDPVR